MANIKFDCSLDGFTDNWIEVSERWTNAEAKALDAAMDGGWTTYLALLKKKVTRCRLVAGDMVVENFNDVTEEVIDSMDLVLVGFVGGILQQAVMRLKSLGNVSARVSLPQAAGKN